jgi:virginiamycin B lyase
VRAGALLVLPVVAATAAAGVIAAPSKVRPCGEGFSAGFEGAPTHVDLGPDGALWATEGQDDAIARFDLETKRATEFPLPEGAEPHDLAVGPGNRLWFSGFNGGLGSIDPETKKVETFERPSEGAQPHVWWAGDGLGYFGDLLTGQLTTFDPQTGEFQQRDYNLPENSGIHSFVEMPDGSAWWALQNTDQLAHFDLERQRFDQFVQLPEGGGAHWVVHDKREDALWVALLYANDLVRYDLASEQVERFDLGLDAVDPKELQERKPLPAIAQLHADAQGEALWVTTLAGGEVRRFDLDTHEVTRVGCGLEFPAQTTTMANDGDGNLWVTEGPPAASGAGRLVMIKR